MLTISKLKRWSINYYIDTAKAAEHAAGTWRAPMAGWGSTTPSARPEPRSWLLAGDTHPPRPGRAHRCQRAGGEADAEVVARWLDDGVAPNGAHGRAFGERGVHGFDLTFCAPKSVSLVRALRRMTWCKAIADAHTTALSRGDGIPGRACRLYPGAQPGHRGERPGAPAGLGGGRISA